MSAVSGRSAEARQFRAWRLRFIMLDPCFGLAWMFNLIHPIGGPELSSTFMLFVMLLVVAVSSIAAAIATRGLSQTRGASIALRRLILILPPRGAGPGASMIGCENCCNDPDAAREAG